MSVQDLQRKVAQYFWFHSIDLGNGIVTPGSKSAEVLAAESNAILGPLDLRGRSVLDVGAWNGYYTVEASRRGAGKLLAVDHFTWLSPEFRGKETFELVTSAAGVKAEARICDVQDISVESVGQWDVVLFLGVFYHLIDPIAAVQRLGAIAKEALVLETHLDALDVDRPAMVFYPGRELNDDPTNWWGPNRPCVEGLLRLAGFREVRFTTNPAPGHGDVRGIFHAYK